MFTGIIQSLGQIRSASATPFGRRLVVEAQGLRQAAGARGILAGDSVCNSGVCLTAVGNQTADGGLTFDVIFETLQKTSLGAWGPGIRVNLELAVTPMQPLGGHFTQGHVDGLGKVEGVETGGGVWRIRIAPGAEAMMHMIPRGSVTVDGVSLTLARVHDDAFEVALIPETLERTTLGALKAGDAVNIECDVIAKTLAHQLLRMKGGSALADHKGKSPAVTAELLRDAGFFR